jgi:hypothetical protein
MSTPAIKTSAQAAAKQDDRVANNVTIKTPTAVPGNSGPAPKGEFIQVSAPQVMRPVPAPARPGGPTGSVRPVESVEDQWALHELGGTAAERAPHCLEHAKRDDAVAGNAGGDDADRDHTGDNAGRWLGSRLPDDRPGARAASHHGSTANCASGARDPRSGRFADDDLPARIAMT